MTMQIFYLFLYYLFDDIAMLSEAFKIPKINHTKLLIIHQIYECPKSLLCLFNMINKHSRNHIHTLSIAHLRIINGINSQNLFQFISELRITIECWAFRVGSKYILLNLINIFLIRSLFHQVLIQFIIFFIVVFCPQLLPFAWVHTETAFSTAPSLYSTKVDIFL